MKIFYEAMWISFISIHKKVKILKIGKPQVPIKKFAECGVSSVSALSQYRDKPENFNFTPSVKYLSYLFGFATEFSFLQIYYK